MTDYTHLLDRLTNATGADRELDAEIFRAIGAPLPEQFLTAKIALEWNDAEKCFTFDLAETRIRYEQPHFTSSIDAAMSLVPEGHVIVSFKNGDLDPKYMDVREHSVWSVTLARKGFIVKEAADVLTFPSGKSSVPAIALCIAAISALKARASCEGSAE